jgi:hypothetical protein
VYNVIHDDTWITPASLYICGFPVDYLRIICGLTVDYLQAGSLSITCGNLLITSRPEYLWITCGLPVDYLLAGYLWITCGNL